MCMLLKIIITSLSTPPPHPTSRIFIPDKGFELLTSSTDNFPVFTKPSWINGILKIICHVDGFFCNTYLHTVCFLTVLHSCVGVEVISPTSYRPYY